MIVSMEDVANINALLEAYYLDIVYYAVTYKDLLLIKEGTYKIVKRYWESV